MVAVHDLTALLGELKTYQVERVVLHPGLWKKLKLGIDLKWRIERFNSTTVDKIPSNVRGVYGFVVRPGVAGNDYLGYLLYIGKTANQGGFKARYRQYLQHKAEPKTRRPSIRAMLDLWPDHLWFCYAEIAEKKKLSSVESKLIGAFLPPYNREFPGKVGQARRAWA
jgi:hypothetical protein